MFTSKYIMLGPTHASGPAQTGPINAQTGPVTIAELVPAAVAQTGPVVAQTGPAVAQTGPVTIAPVGPAPVAQTGPADAQTGPQGSNQ